MNLISIQFYPFKTTATNNKEKFDVFIKMPLTLQFDLWILIFIIAGWRSIEIYILFYFEIWNLSGR